MPLSQAQHEDFEHIAYDEQEQYDQNDPRLSNNPQYYGKCLLL